MEEILEPDLIICDPHHHLWDGTYGNFGYRYMAEELFADTGSGHHIEKTVFVQCRSGYRTDGPEQFRCVGEPEFVVAAEPSGFIAGIVGFADLRAPELEEVLAALAEAAQGRLRGIRQSTAHDPSPDVPGTPSSIPGLMTDPAFRAGFGTLPRFGLSYDAWLFHPQIPELTALAREHEEVPIVLDHLGAPLGIGPYAARHDEVVREWRSSLAELATCPNVVLKLGGVGMPLFGKSWHERPGGATPEEIAAAYGDDIRWCIDRFGADRCMFESNFPVDRQSCSYAALWNAFKLIAKDMTPSEKQALFHDTAARTYRI
ncbi:MAG: amidohydrolase family protein [Acidimicrobiales bacterium]|nr:amidohydrolase family protein [Acidimicrobiales bacterium]